MTEYADRLPPLIRQCKWLIKLYEKDIKARKSRIRRCNYWLDHYEHLLKKEREQTAPAKLVSVSTFGLMKPVEIPKEKWSRNMGREGGGVKQ